MIPLEVMTVFALASIALAMSPGPDNIFVLTQSALFGPKSGIFVTLGLCSGVAVHTTGVALGVAAVFQSSSIAFNALKIIGALYLVYLAIHAWKASATPLKTSSDQMQSSKTLSHRQLYWRGVVMNITNPKVALIFLAFLPQFSDANRGDVSVQILILGAVFIGCAFVVFTAIACSAGFIARRFNSDSSAQKYLNQLSALVFVALAVRLLFSTQ